MQLFETKFIGLQNIPHLKKTKQTQLRSTLWKCRMKGAQFGWSVLWLCLYGLQQENIPVAEALIGDGQKRQWLQGACMNGVRKNRTCRSNLGDLYVLIYWAPSTG